MAMAAAASMSDGPAYRGSGSRNGCAVMLRWLIGVVLAAGLTASLAWSLTTVLAQQKPSPPKPAPAQQQQTQQQQTQQQQTQQQQTQQQQTQQQQTQQQQTQQQQTQQQPAMPVSTEQALYLVRSTLLTLNDANQSGNYTVLRDLAAPDFRRTIPPRTCRRFFPTCDGDLDAAAAVRGAVRGRGAGQNLFPDAVQRFSAAPQIRDRPMHRMCEGPGSAAHHFMLRCARDTVDVAEHQLDPAADAVNFNATPFMQ
jgi:flagellar motor protein MotB